MNDDSASRASEEWRLYDEGDPETWPPDNMAVEFHREFRASVDETMCLLAAGVARWSFPLRRPHNHDLLSGYRPNFEISVVGAVPRLCDGECHASTPMREHLGVKLDTIWWRMT